ncbi:MAG: branched-chain amino acid ABC transporter substrate-binding protein [Geminicoccaceae bacterium]
MLRTIALALALLLGVGSPASAEILLGAAATLSGPLALTGRANQKAIETAVADINAAGGLGGQQVRLITADDGCDPAAATETAQSLVDQRVVAVIGHLCSHASLIGAGVYEGVGIPMITSESTHPRLTEEGRANVFRLIGRDDAQGRLAGRYLAHQWAGRRIAILHDASTYGEDLAMATRQELRRWGEHDVLYTPYTAEDGGLERTLQLLRDADVEVAYLAAYGPSAARVVTDAAKTGAGIRFLGGDGVAMDEFWSASGPAGNGVIFSSRPDPYGTPAAKALADRLTVDGRAPSASAAASYAAVQVWAEAVRRAGTAAPRPVIGALHRGTFDSVVGQVRFDPKGDLQGAAWEWRMWRDGRQQRLPAELAAQ